MINAEYANIEILEVAPPEVVDFPKGVFDKMSTGDHPGVIAAEKQSGADIAGARKGDLDDGERILDVVMLSDGSLLNRDGNDVPQVLQYIKEMLTDRHNNIVRREEGGTNKFEANDRLLTLSFPSLFMFGSGIKRPYRVSEADTGTFWCNMIISLLKPATLVCCSIIKSSARQRCEELEIPFMPTPIE